MIICECDDHDRANDNLAVHDDRLLFDRVHSEDSCLWKVDAESQIVSCPDYFRL